jgi:hypothetical protein
MIADRKSEKRTVNETNVLASKNAFIFIWLIYHPPHPE